MVHILMTSLILSFIMSAGCTIIMGVYDFYGFFQCQQGVRLLGWVYDFLFQKLVGCTFIWGCMIIKDAIVAIITFNNWGDNSS